MADRFELANRFKQKYSEKFRLKMATSPCKHSFTTSLTETNNLFLLRDVNLNKYLAIRLEKLTLTCLNRKVRSFEE